MKNLLLEETKYNLWANTLISAELKKLTEEQWNLEQKSSFNTIRTTVEHLADCEYNWLKRIDGDSTWEDQAKEFKGINNVLEFWLKQSNKFITLAEQTDAKKLEEIIAYKNSAGDPFKSELYKIVAHVMNHGTYHRGQLVTMVRGVGVAKMPSTDLIMYYRSLTNG